jgi:hypothetical protein
VIVAIHDSEESWERFRDEKLIGLSDVGGGFPTEPQETTFTVQNGEAALPPEWTEHDVSDPGIT